MSPIAGTGQYRSGIIRPAALITHFAQMHPERNFETRTAPLPGKA